jgi:L-glutamine:2-deoxy-scyllo-inosose/3-amino-2,3-dideoxy-scyllo-inosose aminotransferase
VSDTNLPAILGGTPIRDWPHRTTPERELSGLFSESEFVRRWLERAPNWEPDCPRGGVELGGGLPADLIHEIAIDHEIAEALGWEPAAFAAEFARVHAPGQEVTVVPANNGTRVITDMLAALSLWAKDLGLRPLEVGSEVIVPALTWQATAGAALSRNLVPVLVDVDPNTLSIDVAAARRAITDRTVAILPVHLYNRMALVHELVAIAKPLGIAVLEDCAHAQGARWANGRAAGTVGDAGSFSFQGSKTLAGGEGGAMISRHRGLALQTASVVTCGRQVAGSRHLQADNDRMPAIVAALLRAQLRRFAAQNSQRTDVYARLDQIAAELAGIAPLATQDDVLVPPTYKWPFRVSLDHFDLRLGQLQRALEVELDCEVATIYEPLTTSRLYAPNTDPARRISRTYWSRIDPSIYPAPVAEGAYRTVLAIEHAAGLDPQFPEAFADAIHKIRANAPRLAREVDA